MTTLKKADRALQEAKQINSEQTFDADRRVQHFDADRLETSMHVIPARGKARFESFRLVPTHHLRVGLSSDSSSDTRDTLFGPSLDALLIGPGNQSRGRRHVSTRKVKV
jgi:hypothetical protein